MKKLILFSIFIVSFIQITYAQEDFIPIESSETFLGTKAKGFMTIRYSSINPGDNNLRRPLIVAEGFDPAHLTMPEVATGYYDIRDFLLDATNDGSNLNTVLDRDFASFYDVIFIDWKKGTDYIRRNALLVKEVIRYVNAHKVAVGGVMQQNAVIGFSMGGLCARWALRDMEDNSENHETRLFATWDSPHQGANVSEGYQRLSNQLYDKYVSSVWQNPYQEEKAFVISPSINEYDSLSCKVELPSNLWLSNSSYSAININFNDGLGYRTVTPGSPLTVSYGTAGLKEWLFRIQISGGTWLYSHAFVVMKNPYSSY